METSSCEAQTHQTETAAPQSYDSSLCPVCNRLSLSLEQRIKEGFEPTHTSDAVTWGEGPYHCCFPSWVAAVKRGCLICRLVSDARPGGTTKRLASGSANSDASGVDEPEVGFRCTIYYTPYSEGGNGNDFPESIRISPSLEVPNSEWEWKVELRIKPTESEPRNAFHLPGRNLEDPHTMWDCLDEWLRTCVSSHQRCREATECSTGVGASWYPTRLLDVGLQSGDNIRLIDTTETNPSGAYLTLSHRWGDTRPVVTTTQTLQQFRTQVPVPLPKTFSDAVDVARRLGHRYLWIDSLCIIQDDKTDWAHESALMDKVYQRAFCNISATGSDDSSGGLFLDSRPPLSPPIIIRSGASELEVLDYYFFQKDIGGSPLQRRGWVFQERMLSPRILHFTQTQVYWECESNCANELHPAGFRDVNTPSIPALLNDIGGKGALTEMLDNYKNHKSEPVPHIPSDSWSQARRTHLWTEVVRWYSWRKLTYHSDKLPALSGIAKHLASLTGEATSSYLAGMWRDQSMVTQLAWFTDSQSRLPRSSQTPSWSWAVTDKRVFFVPHLSPDLLPLIQTRVLRTCHFVDAHTTPATEDPTGAVSGGWLVLNGHMNRMFLGSDIPGSRLSQVIIGDSTVSLTVYLDRSPDHDSASAELFLFSLFVRGLRVVVDDEVPDNREDEEPRYLILSPCSEQPGSYMRRGIAWHSMWDYSKPEVDGKLLWETLPGQEIPFGESFDPERGFRVRIV